MITGVTQFGSFQADGQAGTRFTAHLGGAFRADGSGGGEFPPRPPAVRPHRHRRTAPARRGNWAF